MAAVTRFGAFAAGLVLLAGCAVTYPVATLTPSTPAVPRATAAAPATGSAQGAMGADGDSPQVLDAELGVLPLDDNTLAKMKREKLYAKDRLLRMYDAKRH